MSIDRLQCLGCYLLAVLALTSASSRCHAQSNPEEEKSKPPEVNLAIDPALLHKGADLWRDAPPEVRQAAVQLLQQRLEQEHDRIKARLAEMVAEREARYEAHITAAMGWFACFALLLPLIPLAFARSYPGKFRTLLWHGILAGVMFFVTVHLFVFPLAIFCGLTLQLTQQLDPRMRVVDPVFRLLENQAEYVLAQDLPIGPTIDKLNEGSLDSFLTLLLQNIVEIRKQAEALEPVLHVFRQLDWLTVPLVHAQTYLVTGLFLFSVYPVFTEIARLPFRAAAGSPVGAGKLLKLTLLNWWREIAAVLAVLPVFFVLALLVEVVLDQFGNLSTQVMLDYLVASLAYLGNEGHPSYFLLYLSFVGVALYFFFDALVVVLANWFYLNAALKIFRVRFHEKVPLRQFAPFWRKATFALVWVQLLPVLFIVLIVPIIHHAFRWLDAGAKPHHLAAMTISAAAMFFGMLTLFRLAGGFRALWFLTALDIPGPRIARLEEAKG